MRLRSLFFILFSLLWSFFIFLILVFVDVVFGLLIGGVVINLVCFELLGIGKCEIFVILFGLFFFLFIEDIEEICVLVVCILFCMVEGFIVMVLFNIFCVYERDSYFEFVKLLILYFLYFLLYYLNCGDENW